jgi:hypothetical protein
VRGQHDTGGDALDHPAVTDLDVGVLHRPERDWSRHREPRQDLRQADRVKAGVEL